MPLFCIAVRFDQLNLAPQGFACQKARTLSFKLPFESVMLRNEGIKRRVAKDPEEKDDAKQRPDVFGMKGVSSNGLTAQHNVGMTNERVEQKGQ